MEQNTWKMSRSMEIAALILGIISVAGIMCLAPAFVAAPIGITLALLCRGANKRMPSLAKVGCILSAAGLAAAFATLAATCYVLMTQPQVLQQYRDAYEQVYGQDPFEGLSGDLVDQGF